MVLAAIDIGSNAIRLQVIRVIISNDEVNFKKLEYIRFPLRLGKDVFKEGAIRLETVDQFEKLMLTFKLMIELYEAEGYIATATSAMREAANGQEIIKKVKKNIGLEIEIIPGKLEAEILSKAIRPYLDEKNYIHIDVGGGSTELNIYKNQERINSRSFKLGTVRKLSVEKFNQVSHSISKWVEKEKLNLTGPIFGVGTGGNINKLYQLSNQKYNGSISLTELMGIRAYVSQYKLDERIKFLKMNPDRADVIIPAANIYINVLKIVGADQIMVPKVGLKDGLLFTLFERFVDVGEKEVQFVDTN